ncbi:hypothetical protein ACFFIX_18880 [Metabacillus herbersteinensis]|uniref:Uncharacterized protein n=1 Tax=Metabacillus herbersteinensis TaxID=283816 RepID=A0ABV6GIE9_9BACI
MLLSGITEGISDHEMTAIVFAQHYADTRGNPSMEAWNRTVEAYGTEKALGDIGCDSNDHDWEYQWYLNKCI